MKKTLEYTSEFWYEGYVVPMHGFMIPIINMFKACQILPGKFVYIERQIFSEYAVYISDPVADTPIRPVLKSEQYLEAHPDELCPILLIPLEKRTICITPCGHGVTHSAMLQWLEQKKQCPVCRHPCSVNNLLLPKRS